jgi:CDP-4-dehydro-6-deoxyglucose reductase, E3
MPNLRFFGKDLPFLEGESVLECLLRHEQPVASSCRTGVCQSCLVLARGQAPPASAQKGLNEALVAQGYFLACQCPAQSGLEIVSADDLPCYESQIIESQHLGAEVYRLLIARPAELDFRAGQFLQLIRPDDGLTRSYSIASLPSDKAIELHVALLPQGRMTQYLVRTPGARLRLRGPSGHCFYLNEKRQEPILMAGTGTGLAPLYGILKSALAAGHVAPLYLFHGSTHPQGFYLHRELEHLSDCYPQFHYMENVRPSSDEEGSDLPALVKERLPQLSGFRVYLCGNPEFVHRMKKQCFLAGAAMRAIQSDPFVLARD